MVDPCNLEKVRQLLRLNKTELIRRYQAEGVAIGKQLLAGDCYVIVVYLDHEQKVPIQPVALEGVPLQFEVTGKFEPL